MMRPITTSLGWFVSVGQSRLATTRSCPRGVSVGHAYSNVTAISPDNTEARTFTLAHEDGRLLARLDDEVTRAVARALDVRVWT